MRRRGFTLVEVMVVISIICMVAAILYPSFSRAKIASKVSVSISTLRQLHLATKLYQADFDGGATYGNPPSMGLPWRGGPVEGERGAKAMFDGYVTSDSLFLSPCGCHPDNACGSDDQIEWAWGNTWWTELIPKYREMMPLFWDLNCNDHGVNISNPLMQKRGITILLNGSARTRVSVGQAWIPSFYVSDFELSE